MYYITYIATESPTHIILAFKQKKNISITNFGTWQSFSWQFFDKSFVIYCGTVPTILSANFW